MTTYNLNIDTVNSSLSYYQAEKYIYGSSRLGMLKDSVNVLGSAFIDTDTTNITHTLGNKRYELSNHLGNVLAVITDKPIPHNNGGAVDYWQASIASAYDYSPFGVMLTGRTFEGKQTICHDSTTLITQNTLQEGFNSWGSWTTMGSGLVTYVSGEMQVSNPSSSKKDIGASKTFTTGTGVHNVSFEVIGNTCATVVIWPPSSTPIPIKVSVKDNYGNVVASGNYTTAGTYNLSFTPASSSATYSLEFYMTKASAFCFFRVDDVLVSYDDTTTVTVCKEVEDGYRYGFQNQERDDEIKGAGNSYNYTYRMHDTRLGRFFAVDPLFRKYPYNSSYAFSENVVINAVELEGMEKRDVIGVNGNKATVYGPKSQAGIDQELANSKTPATALDYAKQNMTNNLKNLSANIFSKNNVNNSSNGDLGKALKSSSNVDLKTPVSKVSGLNFTIETSTTTTIKDNDSPITTTINAKNLKVEEVSVTGSNITINHSKEETSIGTKYLSFGKTLKANEISINISIPTNFQGNTVNTSIKFNYTGLKVVAQEVGKSLNNNQSPFLIPVPYYLIFGL